MKLLLSSFLFLCLPLIVQPAQANQKEVCKEILDIAQEIYPQIFPGKPKTNLIGPWCFRCYTGGVCAGTHLSDNSEFKNNGVYTLGGGFGDSPYYVGQSSDVLAALRSQRPDNSKQNDICDTEGLPDVIDYQHEGDTSYITTHGQCVELPENRGICDTPAVRDDDNKPVKTNIHLLTKTSITNLEVSGINTPGFDLESIVQQASNHCIIHAPTDINKHTVHTDICIDVTRQITDSLGGFTIPGFNPPITTRYEGTSTMTRVKDCFDTNAESISDLVTKELWLNKNGSFVKAN